MINGGEVAAGSDPMIESFRQEASTGFLGLTETITRSIFPQELIDLKGKGAFVERGAKPVMLLGRQEGEMEAAKESAVRVEKQLAEIRRVAREEADDAKELRALATEELSEQRRSRLEEQTARRWRHSDELVESSKVIEEEGVAVMKKLQDSSGRIIEASSVALRDHKTGLASGRGMVEYDAMLLIKDRHAEADTGMFEDVSYVVMDMMLFHRGVQELGEDFDARIALMSKGLISVAEYLADGDESLYGRMGESEHETDEGLSIFFPKESKARAQLDELKRLGVKFDPGRFNPGGGDEFLMRVDVNVRNPGSVDEATARNRSERLGLMFDVMDNVINNTTFSASRPVIDGSPVSFDSGEIAQRRSVYKHFYNHLNDSIPSGDEASGVTEPMSRFIYDFKNALRSHFLRREQDYFKTGDGLLDPEVDLRLDYAMVGNVFRTPTLDDAIEYMYNDSPLGEFGSEKFNEYLETVKARLAERLGEDTIRDSQALSLEIEEMVTKDLLEKYQLSLFGEVNGEAKKKKKMQVMSAAARGDAQAIFTVGAVVESGRSFSEFTNLERRKLWLNVIQYWVGEYKIECSKRDKGDPYNEELVDERGGMGEMMKSITQVGNSGNEVWFEMVGGVIL